MMKAIISGVAMIPMISFAALDVRPTKITCEEFAMLDEKVQPKVVYLIEGATKSGGMEDAVISVDEVSNPVLTILDECRRTPKATVWQKVENWVKGHSRKL